MFALDWSCLMEIIKKFYRKVDWENFIEIFGKIQFKIKNNSVENS